MVADSCLVRRLDTFELAILRRVNQLPRGVDETFINYQKRSASRARELLCIFGIELATARALKAIRGWGGHMARQPLTCPLGRLLRFRDLNWWEQTQELLSA